MEYAIVVGEHSCYNTSIFKGREENRYGRITVRDL